MTSKKVDTIKGYQGRPIVLLILDGWGLSPSWGGNAISSSNPVNFNKLWREYPHAVLQAFRGVADERGHVGNSEIGHASIGTGRIVRQDLTDINDAIESGLFDKNPELIKACVHVRKFKSNLHLIGLISDGGIHAHINHIYAVLKLAKEQKISKVYIHAILDGRDVSNQSAQRYINLLENQIKKVGVGQIATLVGRYYAMDKGHHIDRIERAYLAQTKAKGQKFNSTDEAINFYYKQGLRDEFIPPCIINSDKNNPPIVVNDYDSIIFTNFRADRAQSITRAYIDKKYFKGLIGRKQQLLKDIYFVSLTDYHLDKDLPIYIAFTSAVISSNLAHLLSSYDITQLHIAESEKAAHVTYFLNGGVVEPYRREDRIIIPSPNVISYDQTPGMSLAKIVNVIIKSLNQKSHGFIVANIANLDMIGHTGNILACAKAVEIVDKALSKIINANKNGITIITADHGNAEQMVPYKDDSQRETLHSINPVPFILVDQKSKKNLFSEALQTHNIEVNELIESKHTLADVAPTILDLIGIPKPSDMTGQSLLKEIGYK